LNIGSYSILLMVPWIPACAGMTGCRRAQSASGGGPRGLATSTYCGQALLRPVPPIGAGRGAKPLFYPQDRGDQGWLNYAGVTTVQRNAAGSLRVSLNPISTIPQEWGSGGRKEIMRQTPLTSPENVALSHLRSSVRELAYVILSPEQRRESWA
jgi:hypothetical protein